MKTLSLMLLFLLTTSPGLVFAAPTESDHYFRSFDGTRIHYTVSGVGAPVLLIHGFTGTAASWKKTKLYDDLLRGGFKVIAVDLRGDGLSDKPNNAAAYQNDAEAKDLMGLTSQLKLKHYAVVGYSRGSIIEARLLVLDHRVTQGVMGGMGSAFTDPKWPRRNQFYHVLLGEPDAEYGWVYKLVSDMGLDPQIQAWIQLGQPSTSPAELATIKASVLVLCGDQDEDNGSSPDLAAMIPGSKLYRIPGDHRGAWLTQPFSNDILAFLDN